MAESNLATDDPGERYAALELAYTEDRWPDVLQQGESLIADLSTTSDPLESGLLSRAQLLLGHAHLYGLRNPTAALPYYRGVLTGPAEPDLKQIAQAALPYCQPVASHESEAGEPLPAEVLAGAEDTKDPAPLGTEAAQPTPNDDFREPAATFTPASSVVVAAEATPFPINLFETTPPSAAGQASEESTSTVKAWPSLDPFQATSTSEGQAGFTAVTTDRPVPGITESAMPWLDDIARQEEEKALRAQRATERKAATTRDGIEVELVEEPEQLEVAQADPLLAEELDLEMASSGATATPEELARLLGDPELVDGLLRVVLTP